MKTKLILTDKTSAELLKLVQDTQAEIAHLTLNYKSGKERNLAAVIAKRRNLARILTKVREKELNAKNS